MITYHPFGTRGYKNLQIWDMNAKKDELKIIDTHLSQVLMNDQEPIYLDEIKHWKYEQNDIKRKSPFNHLSYVSIKTLDLEDVMYEEFLRLLFDRDDIVAWHSRKHKVKDPAPYYDDTLSDIEWVGKLMFTGTRSPIVVHSELRSSELKQLSTEFVPVYVFWHGLVARDWFRHWKYNQLCLPSKERACADKRFLLYARDFTGSRSYREHFVKRLITNHLAPAFQYQNYPDEACLRSHFPKMPDPKYYRAQEFINEVYQGGHFVPDIGIDVPVTDQSSAFINVSDYNSTAIQVVAETIFEDTRVHITEKTFQPIVAGQPFIMLASSGTLEILKYYGFQTFDHVWDESYDKITDPAKRMSAVIDLIKHLNTMDDFESMYEKCLAVCEHNRKHFFSNRFESQLLTEYDHNWRSAYDQQDQIAKQDPGGSLFWFMNENKYQLGFELLPFEKKYVEFQLRNIRKFSEEQYQGILKQYPWCEKL